MNEQKASSNICIILFFSTIFFTIVLFIMLPIYGINDKCTFNFKIMSVTNITAHSAQINVKSLTNETNSVLLMYMNFIQNIPSFKNIIRYQNESYLFSEKISDLRPGLYYSFWLQNYPTTCKTSPVVITTTSN